MSLLSDQQIVAGLRRGDRAAWDALCKQYGERIWTYLARLVGSDRDAVAEVYQETLMAVAKAGRALREETRLWAWLSRIGQNQAALLWRKRYRAPVDAAPDPVDPAADPPLDRLQNHETIESVRRLLAEMPAEYVAVLQAKYIDGMTAQQIADQLGASTETVRSRLARARRDFRARFDRLTRGALVGQPPPHNAAPPSQ